MICISRRMCSTCSSFHILVLICLSCQTLRIYMVFMGWLVGRAGGRSGRQVARLGIGSRTAQSIYAQLRFSTILTLTRMGTSRYTKLLKLCCPRCTQLLCSDLRCCASARLATHTHTYMQLVWLASTRSNTMTKLQGYIKMTLAP